MKIIIERKRIEVDINNEIHSADNNAWGISSVNYSIYQGVGVSKINKKSLPCITIKYLFHQSVFLCIVKRELGFIILFN